MKAKFFFLGLCALALAACSIDEVSQVNDTNAISFKATATRATAATTNTIDGFTVWAWEKVDGTPEFMNGVQAVRASEGSSTYTTTHTYYWPGAALDFYAFIPAATVETDSSADYNAYFGEKVDMTSDIIETATGASKDTYTGYVANATITSPDAISFDVHVPADAAKEIDLGYAATLGQSAGTVGLNFRHALSQVAFKAQNGNTNWTVDIQGVTLCGIYKEGTYTLPTFGENENGTTTHNATDATKGTWTIEEGAVQGRFNAGIAATKLDGNSSASQSITATNGELMLIPQTVKEWEPLTDPTNTEVGAYVRINCKVTENDTGEQLWPNYHELDEKTSEPLEYAEITVPFDVAWEEGKLYTYTIVFGEGLGYYAPDDENTDLDGTPVLIPIRFTVDIDDFGNLNSTVDTDPNTVTVNSLEQFEAALEANASKIVISGTIDWGDPVYEDQTCQIAHDCTIVLDEGCLINAHQPDPFYANSAVFLIEDGANVVIEGSGTVATDGTASSCGVACVWIINGTVTINGGTFKGGAWADDTFDGGTDTVSAAVSTIYVQEGTVNIYGGTFYAGYDNSFDDDTTTTPEKACIELYNVNVFPAAAYVYGGTFCDWDPANNNTQGEGTNYVVSGYKSVKSETADADGYYWYTVEAE